MIRRCPWSRVLASIVAVCSAAGAHAQWSTDLGDALARAKAERKLVLVDIRRGPDPAQDAFLAATETAAPLARSYASFIRARVIVPAEPGPTPPAPGTPLANLLDQHPPVPSFLVLDPAGYLATSWIWYANPSTHLNSMNMVRDETSGILRSFDLREKGLPGEANQLLGDINIRLRQAFYARELYGRAVQELSFEHKPVQAQKAAISRSVANYLSGAKTEAITELRREASAATSSDVAAAAFLAIGRSYLFNEEKGPAAAAFHDAIAKGEPGSAEWNAARDQLLRLGDRSVASTRRTDALMRIRVPDRTTVSGLTDFAVTADERVMRVDWYVDGKLARITTKPFDATLDLGSTPRLHEIDAIGYINPTTALARASTTVNDRLDELRVYIVTPATDRMSGPTQLEADAYVPPGHTLKSIEFSWNDQPVGVAEKPPYRIDFNSPDTFGYIRAVGTLDDDRTAEDTHIVNAAGFGEAMDVHTLVFPGIVLDRSGARVNGLHSEDFSATDNREKLSLNVHDLPDEPATIGLVVDLSASMSTVLLPLMDIGSRIVRSMAGGRDKMFLASFADQPRILQPVTGSRAPLETRLLDAHAFGNTALVDALAFSMQQFTGATGKRALIFITDGNENASEQTAQACLEMSRAAGVPMYFIIPADSVDTDAGKEFRHIMRKMSETTGGAMFNRPKRDEIDAIVARIRDEVRGQYLLSFAAKQSGGDWRTLRVTVPGRSATVRTVSGYYAR